MPSDIPVTWVDNLLDFSLWADGPNKVGFCRPDLADGAAQWDCGRDQRRLAYVCPCGCKEWRQIGVGEPKDTRVSWAWDGNETTPTLTPSIRHIGGAEERCHWHGFLTAGAWKTC